MVRDSLSSGLEAYVMVLAVVLLVSLVFLVLSALKRDGDEPSSTEVGLLVVTLAVALLSSVGVAVLGVMSNDISERKTAEEAERVYGVEVVDRTGNDYLIVRGDERITVVMRCYTETCLFVSEGEELERRES